MPELREDHSAARAVASGLLVHRAAQHQAQLEAGPLPRHPRDAPPVSGVELRQLPLAADKPSAIICHTVKGKGIPFAENDPNWHHKAKLSADTVSQMYGALE